MDTPTNPMEVALATSLATFETEDQLHALVANAAPLLHVKDPDHGTIKEARLTLYRARTAIERRRKELNEDALDWQRRVNARAKELKAIVEPTEESLKRVETRLEVEAAEVERMRVDAIEERFRAIGAPGAIPRALLARMTEEQIAAALDSEEDRLRREREAREAEARAKAEEEARVKRELEEARRREAEAQARQAELQRKLAEAEAELERQRHEREREIQERLAAEEAERERQRREAQVTILEEAIPEPAPAAPEPDHDDGALPPTEETFYEPFTPEPAPEVLVPETWTAAQLAHLLDAIEGELLVTVAAGIEEECGTQAGSLAEELIRRVLGEVRATLPQIHAEAVEWQGVRDGE